MAQDEVTSQEAGGGGKVFLVMGLLAGVALGGGLSYYYFSNQAPAGEEGSVEKKVPKGPQFNIAFPRIAVPIYVKSNNRSRFVGNYFVDLSVQVRGEENQILVRRSEAQLQHAFISAISQTDLMREDSPLELDGEKVSRVLKERANTLLGAGVVENISIINTMRLSQ